MRGEGAADRGVRFAYPTAMSRDALSGASLALSGGGLTRVAMRVWTLEKRPSCLLGVRTLKKRPSCLGRSLL